MESESPRRDQDLMVAAGRGDREAFGLVVRRHHRSVMRFIYRFLGSAGRDDAEDIAQDVFISALKAASTFEPRAKVLTWLLRIATNACLNYKRKQKLRGTTTLEGDHVGGRFADGTFRPSEDRDEDEESARVRRAVEALAPNYRAVIVLRHYHDLSYQELSDVLEVSHSAVESLLFRARNQLRKHLERRNG